MFPCFFFFFFLEKINDENPTPIRPFVLGLPTGSSPELVYRFLVQYHKLGKLSFRNVVTFNMDEYVGIPQSHPQSYHTFMFENLFRHVDILPQNIHIPSLENAGSYDDTIKK